MVEEKLETKVLKRADVPYVVAGKRIEINKGKDNTYIVSCNVKYIDSFESIVSESVFYSIQNGDSIRDSFNTI